MPSPKENPVVSEKLQQEWFDGLPENVRKAATRAELHTALPIFASIYMEIGDAGVLAWAAYLDVIESGSVDPFDIPEIVGAALPAIEQRWAARLLSDEAVKSMTAQIVRDSGAEVISLAYDSVRAAVEDALAAAKEGKQMPFTVYTKEGER